MESNLDGAQQALVASREAWRKAEEEASRLTDERVSLLVELGASKDELSAFRVEASKEKKALEEAFDLGFYVIFNYAMVAAPLHTIFMGVRPGSQPGCLTHQSRYRSSFFINPRCPQVLPPEFLPPILA